MSYTALDSIPNEIRIGDTVKWTDHDGDYLPADGWVLSYTFSKDGSTVTVAGTDNGDGKHLITVDSSTSLTAGEYKWVAYVTADSERHTLETGRVTALADLVSAASGYDTRSHVKKTLDALEAVIEGRATTDQHSYSIAGRTLQRMEIADVITWRDKYKAYYAQEVRAERIKRGLGHSGRVEVRF